VDQEQIIAELLARIPADKDSHVMWWMMDLLARGTILDFHAGLIAALVTIDRASPGYAAEQIVRIGSIPLPIDDTARESLYQILGEIYCTAGAVEVADRSEEGVYFKHEPAVAGGKNPECESRHRGHWYAVEVKTPSLISFRRTRTDKDIQLTTRLPREMLEKEPKTLPRDNPVKDFMISANAKFAAYSTIRPDALRILTIVWDDYCHEAIAALTSPVSGLLTDNSFFRAADGARIPFPYVDGIVVCRYQHWIVRAFGNHMPLLDPGFGPVLFMQYHVPEPPKAFIQNPDGRKVPEEIVQALNARPVDECDGAEYRPIEMIFWTDAPA
jgi:hypothetical protein